MDIFGICELVAISAKVCCKKIVSKIFIDYLKQTNINLLFQH
ncbi:unnamed protein product [Paramecium octaurelia]|uniref:Uncharacterized protein n=1 Tax=Paramecium octaurelia TaxID=43137 RepID=A0A8S1UHC7_PAROT|nr:unnamed protein product [Paramecium octaurelia]